MRRLCCPAAIPEIPACRFFRVYFCRADRAPFLPGKVQLFGKTAAFAAALVFGRSRWMKPGGNYGTMGGEGAAWMMDEKFMRAAIREAMKAWEKDEVPVGAVIVKDGKIIARGYNLRETKKDPTAHAEMIALRKAARKLGGWRLSGCDMYVTLEPCPMCAGALINSRLDAVYFGAHDPKAGCCASLYRLPQDERFNHRLAAEGGILEEQCGRLLTDYFRAKRRGRRRQQPEQEGQ